MKDCLANQSRHILGGSLLAGPYLEHSLRPLVVATASPLEAHWLAASDPHALTSEAADCGERSRGPL